ncbi:MAG: phosphoribosylformylglycinamidine synthase I [Caldilineaceae bacterium]|nr:phosphoribosylformylglycinamidine synthase I [Caldilineaceae bacterium]
MKPSVLILHASGTNRDGEAARACELAGGAPEILHLNQLREKRERMAGYDALLLPGGFSYGDALGAGVRWALDLQTYFHDQIHAFVDSGKPVLGICNGFQVLVKAGVLPGQRNGGPGMTNDELPNGESLARTGMLGEIGTRRVTLTENAQGRFECRWVHLQVNPGAAAGWLGPLDELIFCPVAHGEGNFQVKDQAALDELTARNLVAFRYVDDNGNPAGGRYPLNPNGSAADIAGICNARGNVVGLMPHPEDHVIAIQNPLRRADRSGLALFRAFIHTA